MLDHSCRTLCRVLRQHHGQVAHVVSKSVNIVCRVVLFLVCFFQIQAMPNPETQRPLGYSVLGGFCVGSTVFGYLFARVLFQQYKQKVFLSAFTVPVLSGYIDKTVSEDTNIIDEEFFAQLQRERELQAQYQQ